MKNAVKESLNNPSRRAKSQKLETKGVCVCLRFEQETKARQQPKQAKRLLKDTRKTPFSKS